MYLLGVWNTISRQFSVRSWSLWCKKKGRFENSLFCHMSSEARQAKEAKEDGHSNIRMTRVYSQGRSTSVLNNNNNSLVPWTTAVQVPVLVVREEWRTARLEVLPLTRAQRLIIQNRVRLHTFLNRTGASKSCNEWNLLLPGEFTERLEKSHCWKKIGTLNWRSGLFNIFWTESLAVKSEAKRRYSGVSLHLLRSIHDKGEDCVRESCSEFVNIALFPFLWLTFWGKFLTILTLGIIISYGLVIKHLAFWHCGSCSCSLKNKKIKTNKLQEHPLTVHTWKKQSHCHIYLATTFHRLLELSDICKEAWWIPTIKQTNIVKHHIQKRKRKSLFYGIIQHKARKTFIRNSTVQTMCPTKRDSQ